MKSCKLTEGSASSSRKPRWIVCVLALGLTLAAIASPGHADDKTSPAWQFEVMPYLWLPGSFGTIQVQERTASVEQDIGDLLTLLFNGDAFAFGGYFAARYDRYSVSIDAYGGFLNLPAQQTIPTELGTLQVSGTAKIKPVIVDLALGYEFARWTLPGRMRPLSLEMLLGTRYTYMGAELEASPTVGGPGGVGEIQRAGNSVSKGFNLAVPIGGVRAQVPLLDALSFNFLGDVGGSTALTWELVGTLRCWLPWQPGVAQTWLDVGYRVVSLKQDFDGAKAVDLQFRGPMLGLGFAF